MWNLGLVFVLQRIVTWVVILAAWLCAYFHIKQVIKKKRFLDTMLYDIKLNIQIELKYSFWNLGIFTRLRRSR